MNEAELAELLNYMRRIMEALENIHTVLTEIRQRP